jgi:predicted nucleotidyltransferase component of viral defense system
MLKISDHELKFEAKNRGYRPEILEKVYRLLDLLEQFMAVPYLAERLALKGGTAINLFCTENFPRLSVDLDFNYIGNIDRDALRSEREKLESIVLDICRRRQYELHRNPRAHAGGKSVLIYQSAMGNKGRLEIDLNYVFRIPLWEVMWRSSPDWPLPTKVRVLDIHELAAGKLHALLGREASRDLFDSYQLFSNWTLDSKKLRLAFVIYAGMEKSWQEIKIDNIQS